MKDYRVYQNTLFFIFTIRLCRSVSSTKDGGYSRWLKIMQIVGIVEKDGDELVESEILDYIVSEWQSRYGGKPSWPKKKGYSEAAIT